MVKEVVIPISEKGVTMSPYERRTGVVLPIWGRREGKTNRHHAHFYKQYYEKGPRNQRAFLRALRFTRLQQVSIGDHNQYHEAFDGTADPISERRAFITTLLNEAGYIPPYVVDMSGGGLEVRETTAKVRLALRRPGTLTIERSLSRRMEIGRFLMDYAVSQPLGHVRQDLLEEFVSLTPFALKNDEAKRNRKLELGMKLTNIAIGVAVDPVEKPFQQARESHALKAQAPICAFYEMKDFVSGHEWQYYGSLQQNIEAQLAA